MKKLLIIGMVLVVAGVLILGCERAIKGTGVYGKVIDRGTKKPVEGATISVTVLRPIIEGVVTEVSPRRALSVTATTDSSGKFSLTELKPGICVIKVRKLGYFEYSFSQLVVKEGKMKKFNVRLISGFGLRG